MMLVGTWLLIGGLLFVQPVRTWRQRRRSIVAAREPHAARAERLAMLGVQAPASTADTSTTLAGASTNEHA